MTPRPTRATSSGPGRPPFEAPPAPLTPSPRGLSREKKKQEGRLIAFFLSIFAWQHGNSPFASHQSPHALLAGFVAAFERPLPPALAPQARPRPTRGPPKAEWPQPTFFGYDDPFGPKPRRRRIHVSPWPPRARIPTPRIIPTHLALNVSSPISIVDGPGWRNNPPPFKFPRTRLPSGSEQARLSGLEPVFPPSSSLHAAPLNRPTSLPATRLPTADPLTARPTTLPSTMPQQNLRRRLPVNPSACRPALPPSHYALPNAARPGGRENESPSALSPARSLYYYPVFFSIFPPLSSPQKAGLPASATAFPRGGCLRNQTSPGATKEEFVSRFFFPRIIWNATRPGPTKAGNPPPPTKNPVHLGLLDGESADRSPFRFRAPSPAPWRNQRGSEVTGRSFFVARRGGNMPLSPASKHGLPPVPFPWFLAGKNRPPPFSDDELPAPNLHGNFRRPFLVPLPSLGAEWILATLSKSGRALPIPSPPLSSQQRTAVEPSVPSIQAANPRLRATTQESPARPSPICLRPPSPIGSEPAARRAWGVGMGPRPRRWSN